MVTREQVFEHVHEKYGIRPDYIFKQFPRYAGLRHANNRKWYGLIMNVPRENLGLEGKEELDIINLKLDPELLQMLKTKTGYFTAYHMNKEHWISISLKDAEPSELFQLIENSYMLTKKK